MKRTSVGRYEIILDPPLDFSNLATIVMLPARLAHLRAGATLRECDHDHMLIECVQVDVVVRLTGEPEDCDFKEGWVLVGSAPVFMDILNQGTPS